MNYINENHNLVKTARQRIYRRIALACLALAVIGFYLLLNGCAPAIFYHQEPFHKVITTTVETHICSDRSICFPLSCIYGNAVACADVLKDRVYLEGYRCDGGHICLYRIESMGHEQLEVLHHLDPEIESPHNYVW